MGIRGMETVMGIRGMNTAMGIRGILNRDGN